MRTKFRLELDVIVETDKASGLIEAAERYCAGDAPSGTAGQLQANVQILGQDPVGAIRRALVDLIDRNPLLTGAPVEIESITCYTVSQQSPVYAEAGAASALSSAAGTIPDESQDEIEGNDELEDLDEFETGLYLCRWPNGEFSLVKADSKRDAILQLDEWAGAEPEWLTAMDTCMVDFRLNNRGEIQLAEFGDATAEIIWDACYPELDALLSSDTVLKQSVGRRRQQVANEIRKAVEHERKRLWHVQGKGIPAKTAWGKELQKKLGTVGPVADHYVKAAVNEILRRDTGQKGKPN